jgi:acetyl-CoA decarbonylase/synthase complex subunit delta
MSIEDINGQIIETDIRGLKVGGKTTLYSFEDGYKNPCRIAYLVEDEPIKDLPPYAFDDIYSDGDVADWVRRAIEKEHPECICLKLASINPNDFDKDKTVALENIRKAIDACGDVPLIVWGCSNTKKNGDVFEYLLEEIKDFKLTIGPVEIDNYQQLVDKAVKNGHRLIANSPIDINMAKQLNILLENAGMKREDILIDPTVSALGYGIEYCYSIIERMRLAALTQNDASLQMPIICNIGRDVWKVKEAGEIEDEKWGDDENRGILWEATTAMSLISAGCEIVVMLNSKAMKLVKELLEETR